MLVLKKNENNNAINYLHLLIHISIQNKRGKTSVLRLSDLITGVWIFWTHTIHIIGGIFRSINSVSSKNLFFKELYHFISILHYKNIIPLKFINRCTSLKPVFLYSIYHMIDRSCFVSLEAILDGFTRVWAIVGQRTWNEHELITKHCFLWLYGSNLGNKILLLFPCIISICFKSTILSDFRMGDVLLIVVADTTKGGGILIQSIKNLI